MYRLAECLVGVFRDPEPKHTKAAENNLPTTAQPPRCSCFFSSPLSDGALHMLCITKAPLSSSSDSGHNRIEWATSQLHEIQFVWLDKPSSQSLARRTTLEHAGLAVPTTLPLTRQSASRAHHHQQKTLLLALTRCSEGRKIA